MFTITKIITENVDGDFTGQKILHPFNAHEISIDLKINGKTKTRKKYVYKNEWVDDETRDAIKECQRFDVKHDGSCGALIYSELNDSFEPYARFDIKRNKNGEFDNDLKSDNNWIPCEPKPTKQDATHWPHFRPCSEDPKIYKWFIRCIQLITK